ncbi:hypothetical protein ACIGXA_22810 [Streptomyces fildesensis]|uniref:Uncharacterized protein n=1 Tax=Streptomyces fildesensis TaxID=375757 RepID=A0ABW8CA93_9ACTN
MDPGARLVTPSVIVWDVHHADRPFRRVWINKVNVGKAYSVADVVEFARRAGFDDLDTADESQVSWRGGGSEEWG